MGGSVATVELGGARGTGGRASSRVAVVVSVRGLANAAELKESLLRSPEPLSEDGEAGVAAFIPPFENRPAAPIVLARLACLATGISGVSSSSKTGFDAKFDLNGRPVALVLVGDCARK